MNVIGLDLSLAAPGIAVDDVTETLHTDPKRGDKRLCDIRAWLIHHIAGRSPRFHAGPLRLAMLEAVPPYDFASAVLERVHGVAREVLAYYDVPFAYANVHALKAFATGNGRADKSEVMDYVEYATGKRPEDDNVSDAWVLHRMGQMFFTPDPTAGHTITQAKALTSIEWPLFPNDPDWPQPYGPLRRKPVTRKCKHGVVCLKNGDHWLHPFDVAVCDRPPK
jgi:Holliday junction resolvasome RuvABC endonuclease subunit